MSFRLEVWDQGRGDGYITVKWSGKDCFSATRFEHFLRMTDAQLGDILSNNGYIQDVLGEASPDERELFITGMRPGSLGERTFTFNCFDCGEQKELPITDLGQPYVCACGTVSHPFCEKEFITVAEGDFKMACRFMLKKVDRQILYDALQEHSETEGFTWTTVEIFGADCLIEDLNPYRDIDPSGMTTL